MEIKRIGSQPSVRGPSEWFTGTVRIDPLFQAPDPALVQGASVAFEPGTRTAWHTHPLGQTLIVTAGCGRVQREGDPIEEIRPGDVVSFSPGEKHWHGATPTTAMTHIAIQEMEQVTDEQWNWKGTSLPAGGVEVCESEEAERDGRPAGGRAGRRGAARIAAPWPLPLAISIWCVR